MARFVKVDEGMVNADRLLFVEAERVSNTGEASGYARFVFDTRAEMLVPLRGRSAYELAKELLGEQGEVVNNSDSPRS